MLLDTRHFEWFTGPLRKYHITSDKSCVLLENSDERWSSRHLLALPPRWKIATDGFHISRWTTLSCSRLHGCIASRPNNLLMLTSGFCWEALMVRMSLLECQEANLMHTESKSTTRAKMCLSFLIFIWSSHTC
jgi:hypothetical protein